MHRVESYMAGAWHRPSGEGRALLDAATGRTVAQLSPVAADIAASVAYGRDIKPTYPGDEIHVVLTCKRKTRMDGRGYGEVAWDTRVVNQHGDVNAAYDVLTIVANAPGVNGAPAARSHA